MNRIHRTSALFFSLLILIATGCTEAYAGAQARRVARNLARIATYEGTILEDGPHPSGQTVKSRVTYLKPNRLISTVQSPEDMAGTTVLYDEELMVFHFPQLRYGVRIVGLSWPDEKQRTELVQYGYRHSLRTHRYELDGTSRVAKLPVMTLRHRAKSKKSFNRRGWTKVYDKFSFPLAGESTFKGGVKYGFRYADVRFDAEVPTDRFDLEIPAGTFMVDWDLSSPAQNVEDVRRLGVDPTLEEADRVGLKLQRIIRVEGPFPAYGAHYIRGPHFLFATAFPANGSHRRRTGLPSTGCPRGA